MEAVAKLNNVPTSPRKMRLVADLIRGEKVDFALNTLKFDSKVGSKRLEKLLLSAISNWQEKNKDDKIEDALNDLAWNLKGIGDHIASARYKRDLLRKIGKLTIGEAKKCQKF